MITINPEADIFFPDKGKICIFLAGKIIEIEDNDDCLASLFLKWLYSKRCGNLNCFINNNKTRVISCLDGLKEAIENLLKMGVLIRAVKLSLQQGRFVFPFIPFIFCQNVWGIRKGQKFFFFIASDRQEADEKSRKIALSWIDEVESGIVAALLEKKIECLPARINVPKIEQINFNEESLFVYDSNNGKLKTYKKKFSKIAKGSDFWRELDRRTVREIGIVPIVKEVLDKDGPFRLGLHTFLSCHKLFSLRDRNDDWQIGRDKELDVAKGKSIMEAIERYCGRKKVNKENLIYFSMKELGVDNCLNPSEIASYSKLQFERGWLKGITNFHEGIRTSWAKVKKFRKDEFKFIPECFISYSEDVSLPKGASRFFFANSNGMAAHINIEKAVKAGVLEIIERDSILIYWINRISPNKIIFSDKKPNCVLNFEEKISQIGYRLAILDLTLDTVPVVMSIVYKENDVGFFCGASAAESKIKAICKSLEEVEFTAWARLKDFNKIRKEINNVKVDMIQKPSDHESIYFRKDMSRCLEFLHRGKKIEFSKSDLSAETKVFTAIKNIGKEVYYIDLTAEDVHNLGLGIRVVRCIIPGFVPMTFGYGYEPLGMKRIYDIPLKIGLRQKPLYEKDVVENYLPHFFP